MANRHDAVFEAIDNTVGNAKVSKMYRMLEIGVYDGNNAVKMIKHAKSRGRSIVGYWGVDLFEDLTPEKSKEEMSKTKLPPNVMEVRRKIGQTNAIATVIKGDSSRIIEEEAGGRMPQMDIIFVDGGHSLETICNDWQAIQELVHDKTYIVLDDYYRNRDDFGCARLANFLATDPAYKVVIGDHVDEPGNGLQISSVTITTVPGVKPLPIPNSVRGKANWDDAPKPIFTPSADDKPRVYSIEKEGVKELSDKETEEILSDPATPALMAAAADDIKHGRLIDHEEVKKELQTISSDEVGNVEVILGKMNEAIALDEVKPFKVQTPGE
mgnify:CR=1 FL=1